MSLLREYAHTGRVWKLVPYETLFLVDVFTGMRQGEILGLRWSCIDFTNDLITVDKQLYMPEKGGSYTLETLKKISPVQSTLPLSSWRS